MKVMTVVGTRPEIIRLSRVMAALDRHLEHVVIHTGQNYDHELNQIFFDDLELRHPDRLLGVAGSSPAQTVGLVISRVDEVLAEFRPDALLLLGDTNSSLAAYPAKRRKIPVFHMEAGNRCFDQRVPEEINRKIVDHISDVNLPYSDIGRECLLAEGFPRDRIIKTGSPMFEVLQYYRSKIDASPILNRLGLSRDCYFLVSAHREETIEDPTQFARLISVLGQLAATFNQRVVVSTHPRTRKRIDSAGVVLHPLVELLKPQSFSDYVKLQVNARVVLSDSGTITEESSILDFPALNIRDVQERHEGFEEGSVMLTGLEWPVIQAAMRVLEPSPRAERRRLRIVQDYSAPNVSEKVVRIILSYTGFVNRVVWRRT